jgi:hypothetical protein
MKKVNIAFPQYQFRTENRNGIDYIFDNIRKKFVSFTPEEHVRQTLIHYLIHDKNYPRSRIAVEMTIKFNNMIKRCDVVVFDKDGKPWLVAECKAPSVKITQNTFDQIARYNLTLKVNYLLVTNGHEVYCCKINFGNNSFEMLEEIPFLDMG